MSVSTKKLIRASGFTLIELLVVIAIIGILASVVLASLNQSRVQARDAARVAQLGQIVTALNLYYLENGRYAQNTEFDSFMQRSFAIDRPRWKHWLLPRAIAQTCYAYGSDGYGGNVYNHLETGLAPYFSADFVIDQAGPGPANAIRYSVSQDRSQYCIGLDLEDESNVPINSNTVCTVGSVGLGLNLDPDRGFSLGSLDTTYTGSVALCTS